MGQPFACLFKAGAFHPLRRHHNDIAARFGEGEIVMLEDVQPRSGKSHDHEFVWLQEAWLSLPETEAPNYPTSEHLRKRALIATGYCTVTDYVCGSNAEALRWAANLRNELDEYAIVQVSRTVIRVFKAKSQSRKAMGGKEFQESKTAILEWVSNLIGCDPAQLGRAA